MKKSFFKKIALEKLHRQRNLKEIIALELLENKEMILYNHFYSNITCINTNFSD